MEMKCPKCKSTKIVFCQNFGITKEYKINKNGTISKRSKILTNHEVADGFGYGYCNNCDTYLNVDMALATGKIVEIIARD
jgi:hypothetical protein